jgi:hypothetical protein
MKDDQNIEITKFNVSTSDKSKAGIDRMYNMVCDTVSE